MELDTYVEGNMVVIRAVCTTPTTVGSVREGSTTLTIRDAADFADTDPIVVRGAGYEGGDLYTTISNITGNTITLTDPAVATVSRAKVGKLTDPGTVTFTARRADEAPSEYTQADSEVSSPSTGVWELRLINDESDWSIHFQGTTPCHCAGEAFYRIKRARALA